MSIAVARHRNQLQSTYPRVKTPDSPRRSSPRPSTPSRSQNRSFEPQPRGGMDSPTPAHRRRVRIKKGARKPDQRDHQMPDGTADQEPSSEDELMNLLGVGPAPKEAAPLDAVTAPSDTPAQKRGLLPVTKEDIVASTKSRRGAESVVSEGVGRQKNDAVKRNTPKKKGPKKDLKETILEKGFAAPAREDTPSKPPIDPAPPARSAVLSGKAKRPLHDRRNRDDSGTMSDSGLVPFDLSALSQSLPNRNAGLLDKQLKNGKANGKSHTPEWDMPATSGGQELTWQQKLQTSTPSSGRGSRPSSDRKAKRPPSAFNQSSAAGSIPSRPSHTRRASADSVPVAVPPKSAPPYRAYGFDDDIPYHIGFNVHRAPQTPAKGAINPVSANTPLPIIPGEFPRINKVNKAFDNVLGPRSASGSSLKYAGPTAHSSPHAASLAKPDLDDF